MKSIREMTSSELTINKSEFINYLTPVSSVEEAKEFLTVLRKKFPDANHHCFAYIVGKNQDIQKYSDDGEPSKTAGMPMIEVLKKHDLTNVLTVSIRYFGGIKLGAGGLVRAYTKSVSEAIKTANFTNLIQFTKMNVIIPFDLIGKVEKYIREQTKLLHTEYTEGVVYLVEVESRLVDNLKSHLTDTTKGVASYKRIEDFERYE